MAGNSSSLFPGYSDLTFRMRGREQCQQQSSRSYSSVKERTAIKRGFSSRLRGTAQFLGMTDWPGAPPFPRCCRFVRAAGRVNDWGFSPAACGATGVLDAGAREPINRGRQEGGPGCAGCAVIGGALVRRLQGAGPSVLLIAGGL
jgi:hypothetical protein